MLRQLTYLVCTICVGLFACHGQADAILLRDNNILTGRIEKLENRQVYLETQWAGMIKIDLAYVQSLETDKLLWVRLKGQENFRLLQMFRDGETTWLTDQEGNRSKLSSQQQLVSLQSEQPDNKKWLYSGKVNLNISLKRGEHRENELKTFGRFTIRDKVHRHTFSWDGDYSKEDGELDDKNLQVNYDYNRFFNQHWYLLGNGLGQYEFEESPYRRYALGTGIGYQFWSHGTGSLKSDIGPNYLWESYRKSDNVHHWALRWRIDGEQKIVEDVYGTFESLVFHQASKLHQTLWTVNLGLKYQLSASFWLNTRYHMEYDSRPAEDGLSTKTDLTFGIGYGW